LGSLVRYFDPDAPYLLVKGMSDQLAGLEEFFRDWGYLFDTEWTEHLRAIRWTGKIPEVARLVGMNRAGAAFEACLLRSRFLSSTPAASAATAILDFDRTDDIQAYLASPARAEDLAEALAADAGIDEKTGDVPMGSLYGGFGELISFLDDFQETRNHLAVDEAASALFRKVAQLLRWRFHFFESKSSLRDQFVSRYLNILEVEDYALRVGFQSHLDSLGAEWRGMQGPAQAVAGA
jgi:hypothetical protein